jgi:hypothetical protein
MAYLIGYATKEEKKELRRRGWQLETPSKTMRKALTMKRRKKYKGAPVLHAVLVHVDTTLFEIMDGPDWEH